MYAIRSYYDPLLADDSCYFLAADFDEADWREDVIAFIQSCRELSIPAALEISRSGNGAHVWIFFAEPVPAREARQLGTALISHTCNRTRQLSLLSYDRLFPNQDTLPKGGFSNLIALPLQKQPREHGHSVFVNERLEPYPDQWAFLASARQLSRAELDRITSYNVCYTKLLRDILRADPEAPLIQRLCSGGLFRITIG